MVVKKQVEARCLDVLRHEIGDFPSGTLAESESPDFLISTPHDTLGIEVTRIFQASRQGEPLLQSQESERQRIVQQAKQLCTGLPAVTVSVHFGAYPSVAKADRHSLSHKIAKFVSSHVPREGEFIAVKNSFDSTELPDQVAFIHILGLPQQYEHSWTVPTAGFLQTNFIAELQSVLDEKGQLVSEYLRKCNRCWLLIVADGRAPSSLFEPSAETRHHMYRSSFERAFYLESFGEMVVELTTERSPNNDIQPTRKEVRAADA
jgi:hypothetical protein